jgi:hypothetical protein
MMAKTHPILALLLTLALMLQGHGGAPAHESGCCPDDCSMDAAFCPVPGAGAACAACQAAAISPHALNAAAVTGKRSRHAQQRRKNLFRGHPYNLAAADCRLIHLKIL